MYKLGLSSQLCQFDCDGLFTAYIITRVPKSINLYKIYISW